MDPHTDNTPPPGAGVAVTSHRAAPNSTVHTAADFRVPPTAPVRGVALRRSLYYIIFAWFFGSFWLNATTGATATHLAQYLGANDLIFGYLAAAGYLGSIFQLFGSLYTERTGRVKGIFLWSLTTQRLLYVPLAFLPWICPARWQPGAMAMVLILFLASAAGNIGSPAWTQWMAHLVPARVRGKYFSRRNRVGIMVSAATAILVGVVLDAARRGGLNQLLAPLGRWTGLPPLILVISVLFLLGSAAGVTDIQSYRRVSETPPPRQIRAHAWHDGISGLIRAFRDRNFLWYVLYSSVYTFALAFAGTFTWVMMLSLVHHATGHSWFLAHPYLTVCVMLMLTTNVGQILGYPFWGRLIDRLGCKPVILIASSLHSLTLLVWVFISVRTLDWGFAGAFVGGLVWSAIEIANFNLLLAVTRKGGAAYQAVLAIMANLAGMLAGLGAGALTFWLQQHHVRVHWMGHHFTRYNVLFALSLAVKCVADYAILPRVSDPGAKPVRYAFRYILGNVFDMLNSQVLGPVRNAVNEGFYPWRRIRR